MVRFYPILVAAWLAAQASAADPARLALEARAAADFARVAGEPLSIATASGCVQSQAALAAVAGGVELAGAQFRLGYCALAGARLASSERGFADAADALERAAAIWRERLRRKGEREVEASAATALAAVARLAGGARPSEWAALDRQLQEAAVGQGCPEGLTSAPVCREALGAVAPWRGWIAVRQRRHEDAAGNFALAGAGMEAWTAWVEGRRAYDGGRHQAAAAAFERAVDGWSASERTAPRWMREALLPPGEVAGALVDLAEARLAAGEARAAIESAERAVRRDPGRAWTLFVRGRAREESGDTEAAVADFNLAARRAFASDAAEGEARFYRAVWTLRRGDAARAEQEFNGALNGGVPERLAADAAAWRALAAVRAGGCGVSREILENTAAAASPLFPRKEVRAALDGCVTAQVRLGDGR